MSIPKNFELDFVAALRRDYPLAWVQKQADIIGNAGRFAVKSPPDVLVVAPEFCMLAELKAVKGQSMPFNRLEAHQLEHLERFNTARRDAHGVVGLLFYNGKLGKERVHRSFLLPVDYWVAMESALPRKSVPLRMLESDFPDYEMEWRKGMGWFTPPAMNTIIGGK